MPRRWTIQRDAVEFDRPDSSYADIDKFPGNGRPAAAFDPASDEIVYVSFIVPDELVDTTKIKVKAKVGANTTSTTLDARFDFHTEFIGPGESLNVDAFDATPDSATALFSATAYSMSEITVTLTPGTTPVAGDKARLKIVRDADHATLDDLAVDVLMDSIEIYEDV